MAPGKSCCKSLLCGLFLALGLALAPSTAPAQNPPPPNTVTFSPPQNISNNTASSPASDQQMAVDSTGRIYTVWIQNNFQDVLFSRSVDGGKTFSSPQMLWNPQDGSQSQLPAIAVDPAGNINVTWISTNGPDALLSRSTDGGTTFSTPKAIARSVLQRPTGVAGDSAGNIYFSWVDNASRNVFFSRSLDQGATFSAPTQVSNITNTNSEVVIWALGLGANGDLDLVWSVSEFSIWLSQSKDGGVTFSSPKMLAQAQELTNISLALDSTGTIYIAYNTVPQRIPGQPVPIGDVFLVSSKDGGNTSSTTNLTNNPNPQAFSCCPQVLVDSGGNVDLVWVDPAPVITFARSTDGGSTFSRTAVSSSGSSVGSPRIAVDSKGAVNVIWSHPNDIFYSRSTDNGTTFSSPQNVSNDNFADLDRPVLALDPCGNVNVVWQDFSPGPGSSFGPGNIFFSRGTTPESIASGCGPAIVRIQSADAYPGDSVTLNNTAAGNFVIVAASWADLTSDPTISDSALNTWNALPVLRGPAGQGAVSVKLFYAMNIKGGNTTITLSSSLFDVGIHAVEYSGVATSNALDVISTAVADGSTGTTTPASGSFTPTAGDLVYVYYGDEGTAQSAITAGPGYLMIAATGDHADGSEENLASLGTQTASFNLATTSWGWALYVATFKASAGQH